MLERYWLFLSNYAIGGEPIKNTLQELDENQLKKSLNKKYSWWLDENQLKKSQERWTRTNSKNLDSSFPKYAE